MESTFMGRRARLDLGAPEKFSCTRLQAGPAPLFDLLLRVGQQGGKICHPSSDGGFRAQAQVRSHLLAHPASDRSQDPLIFLSF